MTIKLPKQWKHWCKKAGLRPETTFRYTDGLRRSGRWMSLNGQGRKWRISLRNTANQNDCVFQAGETYEKFDRWARSRRTTFEIPQTWAEFKAALDYVKNNPALDSA